MSHKPVAEAAGLGRIGIHRNLIHPRFGSFVLLGTVITDARVTSASRPLDYNPCLECKLCVAACPTGATGADGAFNFGACYTHNYREFMGGSTSPPARTRRRTSGGGFRTWVRFLAKEASLSWAVVTGRIRLWGSPRLLLAFARCFPS